MASWLESDHAASRWSRLLAASGFALLLSMGGCKQGVNEVCQVTTDCEPGLTCNTTTGLCQQTSGPTTPDAAPGGIDAQPLPDAPPIPLIDAAMPDAAMPDAAMTDAAMTDAPPL